MGLYLLKIVNTKTWKDRGGRGDECVVAPPVRGFEEQSFQAHLVRLPVRSGGLGLRSLVDTSPAAFLGSLEMALPHFGGEMVCAGSLSLPWETCTKVRDKQMGDSGLLSTGSYWTGDGSSSGDPAV